MAAERVGHIVVVGSVNMDLVCRTPRMPRAGETILGKEGLVTIPGGKGANQAVAAARLGGDVHFVARVGADDFGERLVRGLQENNVHCEHVKVTANTSSGCATIVVDDKGENSIVVSPGANGRLTPEDIDAAEGAIKGAGVMVVQLEIPIKTVQHALAVARRNGVYTIVDPAPVPARFPRGLYMVDLFTPNQNEAELLLGLESTRARRGKKKVSDPKAVATDLMARGARNVVLKLSARGALVVSAGKEITSVPGFKVKVVDTTAAGDAFTGALAVGRAEGMGLVESARFANAAGGICCQTFGAQPALPTRAGVEQLLVRGR